MSSIDILRKCSEAYSIGDTYVLTAEDIDTLENDIERLQYKEGQEVTDDVYDNLFVLLKTKFADDPFFSEVGAPERGGKVPLEFTMGSMDELHEGDWNKWKQNTEKYVITAKLDGCSCGATYERGKLKCAQSRGNGIEGADITRHFIKLQNKGSLQNGKVRGEIIIPKHLIPSFIDEIEQETGKRYKNARNAVAGQLNSKEGAKAFYKYAHFVTYRLIEYNGDKPNSFSEELQVLANHNFEVTKIVSETTGEALNDEKLISMVQDVKANYNYECDGIILTLDTPSEKYQGNETSSLNPRDSRKFKVGATNLTAETVVKNIEWNPSKDGVLCPVAILEPIELNGVTVSRATVNNWKWLKSHNVGKDAKVVIKRCGEVIPNIIEVIEGSDDDCLKDILKDNSHIDGVDIILNDDENKNIPELDAYYAIVNIKKIEYFCNMLNVQQAGLSNLLSLAQSSGINLKDYDTEHFLLELPSRFKDILGVNGDKLYNSLLEKLSNVEVPVLYSALGCFGPSISTKKLEKVFDKYNTLDVTKEQLEDVDGFADKTINQYLEFLHNYKHWNKFIEGHLSDKVKYKKKTVATSSELSDLKVVFTGVRDKEMEERIIKKGGQILSSVNKNTTLLIAKDTSSSSTKLNKAKDLGIKIMSYDEAKKKY